MRLEKQFKFECAHRLGHAEHHRCRGVHGHSYVCTVVVEGTPRPETDMVQDFSVIKKNVGGFIDLFDHTLVLSTTDPLLRKYGLSVLSDLNPRWMLFHDTEPTAEVMAALILAQSPSLVEVRLAETATSLAVATKGASYPRPMSFTLSPALRGHARCEGCGL